MGFSKFRASVLKSMSSMSCEILQRNTSDVVEVSRCHKEAQTGIGLSKWIATDLAVEVGYYLNTTGLKVAAVATAGTNRSPTSNIQ